MRRAFSAFCCVIVCLQILVGVPLLVCIAFFTLVGGGAYPITVDVRAGGEFAPPTTIPPPNVIPTALREPHDNPILTSRAANGSPLAGTILAEVCDHENEQDLFVAALEKVTLECAAEPCRPAASHQPASCQVPLSPPGAEPTVSRLPADDFVIQHLYEMANADEAAGNFDRADQWRAHAREIREPSASAAPSIATPPGL